MENKKYKENKRNRKKFTVDKQLSSGDFFSFHFLYLIFLSPYFAIFCMNFVLSILDIEANASHPARQVGASANKRPQQNPQIFYFDKDCTCVLLFLGLLFSFCFIIIPFFFQFQLLCLCFGVWRRTFGIPDEKNILRLSNEKM